MKKHYMCDGDNTLRVLFLFLSRTCDLPKLGHHLKSSTYITLYVEHYFYIKEYYIYILEIYIYEI